jgi:4-diphosphocytidyl-2-C-methyl-D-erythritol kinase
MRTLIANAPGKLNLFLHLGPTRDDGYHELVSLFESVSLHDTLTLVPSSADRVVCEAVPGENLVEKALRASREAGLFDGEPVEITIDKRVPVAAGMGGGSGDAAATLRMLARLADRPIDDFERIAFMLGADVPSQLIPGAALVRGAGEHVETVAPHVLADANRAYVIVEQPDGLSTADVFNQADHSELPAAELAGRDEAVAERFNRPITTTELASMIHNDLAAAIEALRPELAGMPGEIRDLGALAATFTGSGPTCFGLFADLPTAEAAAEELRRRGHLATIATPVDAAFGEVTT